VGRLVDLLRANPLLFAVVALGYPLGRLKIAGGGLGVASVLFAGLAVGALDPDLKLPEVVY
jgi:putative transport protein